MMNEEPAPKKKKPTRPTAEAITKAVAEVRAGCMKV